MINKIPSLNISAHHEPGYLTPRYNKNRHIRGKTVELDIEILEDETKLVPFEYFRKKEMFCTVSRQKDGIQFYTDKNSVLLGIWIDVVNKFALNPENNIWQLLHGESFDLQMHAGVPSQFAGFNNNATMKSFLLKSLKQLSKLSEESIYSIQKSLFQMLFDYPFLVFSGVCFIRAIGLAHLKQNRSEYQIDLLGNQQQLFKDYSSQLRNTPLGIISDSLQISISLRHDLDVELIGHGKTRLSIQSHASSYVLIKDTESVKPQKGSAMFNSTLASSTQELELISPHKICNRCMNLKTGKFCDCRKMKNPDKDKTKKRCNKCQTQYIFVCECDLDE